MRALIGRRSKELARPGTEPGQSRTDAFTFGVVQLNNAKPQNQRFNVDTHVCEGCQRAEYAYTCGE
jgi:hypothetical protein